MHKLLKIYQENTPTGLASWVVECPCGWKEKAIHEKDALSRINEHIKMPHKR